MIKIEMQCLEKKSGQYEGQAEFVFHPLNNEHNQKLFDGVPSGSVTLARLNKDAHFEVGKTYTISITEK
jgi:hypothetical protein